MIARTINDLIESDQPLDVPSITFGAAAREVIAISRENLPPTGKASVAPLQQMRDE